MNIFVLSLEPEDAAKQHCDKHVIKMILETTQLLYMCWSVCGRENWRQKLEAELKTSSTMLNMERSGQKVNFNTYKCGKGHTNHPCSKWVRESAANYTWLVNLGMALCREKMHRWPRNKQHSCLGHLEVLSRHIPEHIEKEVPMTPFALAMPDEYKQESIISSYQKYYNEDKQKMFKWTNRETPPWIIHRLN
mgnify:CR=1 FL=1